MFIATVRERMRAACESETNVFGRAFFAEHVEVVAARARELAGSVGADAEIAAWLHDYSAVCDASTLPSHAAASAEMARGILAELRYDAAKAERVAEAIARHSARVWVGEGSPEAVCVSNADAVARIVRPAYWLYFAFVVRRMGFREGRAWLRGLVERQWEELIEPATDGGGADRGRAGGAGRGLVEGGDAVEGRGEADGGGIAGDCGGEAEDVGDGAGVFLEVLSGGGVAALGFGAEFDAGAGGAGGDDDVVGLVEEAVEIGEVAGEREGGAASDDKPERGGRGAVEEVGGGAGAFGSGDGDASGVAGGGDEVLAGVGGEGVGAVAEGVGEIGEEGGGAEGVEVGAGEGEGVGWEAVGEVGEGGSGGAVASGEGEECGGEKEAGLGDGWFLR